MSKKQIESTTITRDLRSIENKTGNIYEALAIIAKRANQISNETKQELQEKLKDFASSNDNLEEIFENREQIEISRFYERMPKSTLVSINEYIDGNIQFRYPDSEKE
jgi:DNA-directed RNA polymerase subunit K/omega